MIKRRRRISIAAALCGAALLLGSITTSATAQERGGEEARESPNASVSQTIGTTVVTIHYGRPGVKGREVFGGSLVPFGEVWRTGANECTTITFSDDVTVQGEELAAGTYSLYTIPEEGQWTLIFNDKMSWGTEYDESQDVLRVQTKAESADEAAEQLLFYFEEISENSGTAVIRWDDVKVPWAIEV